MLESDQPYSKDRLQFVWRWGALSTSCLAIVLLIVAGFLSPSYSGFGTHQQLGLPPCTSIALLGAKCPACGMTTSWSHLVRGDFAESIKANAGGAMLAIIALASVPASWYFFWTGKSSPHTVVSRLFAFALTVAMGVAVLQWLWRLL